jgi:hypothetical protein
MAAITKEVEKRLDSLRGAGLSGQLGVQVGTFVVQTVDAVYAAPGNFKSAQEILDHLATLTYLVDLHVYKRR